MDTHYVGKRVKRPVDVFAPAPLIKLQTGTVVKRFSKFNTSFGDYPELYEVRWDSGSLETFLPHGIDDINSPRWERVKAGAK